MKIARYSATVVSTDAQMAFVFYGCEPGDTAVHDFTIRHFPTAIQISGARSDDRERLPLTIWHRFGSVFYRLAAILLMDGLKITFNKIKCRDNRIRSALRRMIDNGET